MTKILIKMPAPIYFRVFGQAVILTMHSVNSIVMLLAVKDESFKRDPEIRNLDFMQSRFLTVWNIAFQLFYSVLALACDVSTLTNKDHLIPKPVKKFRDFFFSSILFPGSLLVFIVFWPFYLYDRNIIFPEYIDKVFSQKSNYIMHIAIVPSVLWELAFQPRNQPKSHWPSVIAMAFYDVIYNLYIHHTYLQRGLWPYPLLGMAYGTIYFIILHTYIVFIMLAAYYAQWPLRSFFWRKEDRNWSKIKSK